LQLAVKRILDLLLAASALLVFSPLIALLALLIRLESPGPALLAQRRLGRGGRVFAMFKLRTMVDGAPMVLNADGSTRVVDGDPRVTRLGAVLRRLGLDELPQLVNVLRGEMSLIGPRPDHDFQLPAYSQQDYRKLAMRPGITSLAQVSGHNALSWRERMALEIEYVERFSLGLDVQIAWRTVGVVRRGTGVNNPAAPTEADGHTPARGKNDQERTIDKRPGPRDL
jgi:lipopolysaccharide/colanic/teichoic acid biosynthesis glycosyltransferase